MTFSEKLELIIIKYFIKDFLSYFLPGSILFYILQTFIFSHLEYNLFADWFIALPAIWCIGFAMDALNKKISLFKKFFCEPKDNTITRSIAINHLFGNLGIAIIWLWIILVLLAFISFINIAISSNVYFSLSVKIKIFLYPIFSLATFSYLIVSALLSTLFLWVAIKRKKEINNQ